MISPKWPLLLFSHTTSNCWFLSPPHSNISRDKPWGPVNPRIHENIYNIHFSEHDICIGRGVHQFLKLLSLLSASSLNVFRFLVSSGIWPKCTSNHTPPCGLLWSTGQGCSPSPGWVAATCHLTLIFHFVCPCVCSTIFIECFWRPGPCTWYWRFRGKEEKHTVSPHGAHCLGEETVKNESYVL